MPDTKDDLVGELVDREPMGVLEGLRAALTESVSPSLRLDPARWGPAPDAEETRAAGVANAVRLARDRARVAAGALSRGDVAELLGISPQAVSNRIRQARLVAVRAGRRWLLPAWQFDPEATDPVLPGIADLLGVWPGSPVALSRWATTPSRDLDDRAPAAALHGRQIRQVVAAARAIGA